MSDTIHLWLQEGRYGFVGALLRERRRREAEDFEREHKRSGVR